MPGPLTRRTLFTGSLALAGLMALQPTLGLAQAGGASPVAPGLASDTYVLTAPGDRAVEITRWLPEGEPRGTILFSHGAGSSPRYYDLIVEPWISAGWRVLAPLHVDSREHPHTADYPGLASWKTRIEDMRLLVEAMGDAPFVAAGHSYGGLVALTLGGAAPVPPEGMALPLMPRLASAVIAFSPPAPIPVLVTPQGYGALAVPALVQTGTMDVMSRPGGVVDPESWKGHLAAYDAAAPGMHRYGLLLDGANHDFGGAICDFSKPGPAQLAQIDLANRYAGLFLAAYGLGDDKARRQLDARVTDALPARLQSK